MKDDLKLVIVGGSHCSSLFMSHYEQIYSHWKSMWQSTFLELDGHGMSHSDNFSRQNEILGIFHQHKCVAVVCHRFVNIGLSSIIDDSYFLSWPKEDLMRLRQRYNQVAIGNQISIDPAYRKLADGTAMKDILLGISLMRLNSKEIDCVLGAVREDKSLDQLFMKFGATILQKNIQQHNVTVALICFQKSEMRIPSSGAEGELLSRLYSDRKEDPSLLNSNFIIPKNWRAS